jgi:hypothetical protein
VVAPAGSGARETGLDDHPPSDLPAPGHHGAMSKRVSWFLIGFAVWSWVIWPTFLKNIWADSRSWNHGMTTFFGVHLVLTIVSLVLGSVLGVLGIRGLLATRSD